MMAVSPTQLTRVTAGQDRPSAGQQNLIRDLFIQNYALPAFSYVSGTELLTRVLTSGGITWRWGKVDTQVGPGDKVTVSLWQKTNGGWDGWDEDSDTNIEDVYAPPVQTSDIDAGTFVLIAKINGRWVILVAACPE